MAGTPCLLFSCPLSTLHGTWHSAHAKKHQLNPGKISLGTEEGQTGHQGTDRQKTRSGGELERLGLEKPTTLEELEAVLTEFKEKDANGNPTFWTDKWYLDPVSRIEVQKGYGLTQNPGW